jgi:hypothetical protein
VPRVNLDDVLMLSAVALALRRLHPSLAHWAEQKYKRLRGHLRRATNWVARTSKMIRGCRHTGDGRAAWPHGGSRFGTGRGRFLQLHGRNAYVYLAQITS